MSQNDAGPEDDLQAVNVQVKRIEAATVMSKNFIFIGLFKTKIANGCRILEKLLTV